MSKQSPPRRSGTAGTLVFLFAIGALVAGAGAAGLHYRAKLWDDHAQPDHVATNTDAWEPPHLTSADDIPVTALGTKELSAEPALADAGAPEKAEKAEKPKATPVVAPVARPAPVRAKPKPKPADELPADRGSTGDSDAFNKPD